jgi:sigma-B regulation protein RsbU (phosphoserine phosphatase)
MGKKQKQKKESWQTFRRFFYLYKSDLSLNEIERLVKRDVPGVYEFYARKMEKPDQKRNWLVRSLTFSRNFFMAFLLRLTPARRLFYSIALFLFFYGLITGMNNWIVLSFILFNVLLALEVADKMVAKDELEIAREIQTGLMPTSAPENFKYDMACFSEPAREVGGDYYDFIPSKSDNQTFIVVGDVSGKGMAAALYMVRIQALLQLIMEKKDSPKDILIDLNKNVRKILRHDYFISMAISRVDDDGNLRFCRAGHMPLIHYSGRTGKCETLEPGGIAVGLENNGRFDETIEEITVLPKKNDILVYYTDGVTEAMNGNKVEYGETALKKIICDNAQASAEGIKTAILEDIARFRRTEAPHDDLTIVVVKC